MRAAEPLPPYPNPGSTGSNIGAKVAPDRVFLAQRATGGGWLTLTYGDALEKIMHIGSALLALGASVERRC